MKEILLDYGIEKIKEFLNESGQPKYRADQIFKSLYNYKSFKDMTDLPLTLREKLSEKFYDLPVEIIETLTSKDKTVKFLFKLTDGNVIEGVLMRYKYGNTVCISTQVGCRMNCAFCASGIGGLIRNLSSGEILSEVLAINKFLGGTAEKREVTNIVLMGSGEPLDNYDNTVDFIKKVSDPMGINISTRNISLSTCGLVPNIYRFADEGFGVNLTISLHSPFDEERKMIMPIARSYTIKEILDGCNYYFEKTGRRYIFEYVLILGNNDSERHAAELIKLLKGKPCLVNLIRLNKVEEKDLKPVTDKNAYRFMEELKSGGLNATVRRQIGTDIDGACGQLRRRYITSQGGENE